jgi:hypothetical protein
MRHPPSDTDVLSGVLVLTACGVLLVWSALWLVTGLTRMSIDVPRVLRAGVFGI